MSVINQIIEDIRQKSLTNSPGERLPSIRSLMRRYNTSLHSVNVALRRLEAEHLVDVRKGSGIFISAQSDTQYVELHRPRYPSRGFDIKELSLERALAKAGYKMLVNYHAHDYDDPSVRPSSRACAYVVMSTIFESSPTFCKQLRAQPAPVFSYARTASSYEVDYITGDDYQYLSLLVKHLISLGHRRLALLANEPSVANLIPREEIIVNIAELCDLPPPVIVECHTRSGESSMIKGYEGLSAYLRQTGKKLPFTALISSSPSGVIGSLRAFHEAGIRVPQQCSLCCTGIDPENSLLTPSVTEVGLDEDQWGEGVLAAMQQRFSAPKAPPFGIKLPPKLHVRESTCKPSRS